MCDAIVVLVPVDPGNNPPAGPVNPGNFPADMTTPDDGDDQDAEIDETPINDDDNTGKGEVVDIEDQVTPEAGGVRKGHWALINLIATVGGALLALILLIGKHKKDVDDENDENAQVVASEMDEEDEEFVTRRRKWKFISTAVALVSVVIFFLTENMSLPMVWVDKYTLLMLALFLLNAVSLYMGKRWHEEDKDEEEQKA